MKYTFFPGCSLQSSSSMYMASITGVSTLLGIELSELSDWNCCGGSSYLHLPESLCLGFAVRNLALAEKSRHDLVTPCNACYAVLKKTAMEINRDAEIRTYVDDMLNRIGMRYRGVVKVRHLLELYVHDVGLETIRLHVKNPLTGLNVACYYGCQGIRPSGLNFDDPESPELLDILLTGTGAAPITFPHKARCCGGTSYATNPKVAYGLLKDILTCAMDVGADCIATCCPVCQSNLDIYQNVISEEYGLEITIPVVYFTQLMGMAFNLPKHILGLDQNITGVRGKLELLTGQIYSSGPS